MLHGLIATWFHLLEQWHYFGIILLMAMESSIIPVPSEVVIPPAAYWATQGKMNFWGVVLAGTFGSWLGSAASYWIARWLERAIVVRFGKWFHITEDKVARAERFVHRYESGGIFFARLLPVVRHLISIPAGFIKMDFRIFSAMTVLGSFVWCLVLAKFSVHVFQKHPDEDLLAQPEAMVHLIKHESLPLVGAIVILCGLYLVAMKLTASKTKAA